MKAVPLYLMRHDEFKINDIIFTLFIVDLFLVWVHLNGKDFVTIIEDIEKSMLQDKQQTPFMMMLQNMENKFKGYFSYS
jgi:hypothetical protein